MTAFQKHLSRRKFLATLGICGLGGGGYARALEPEWLQIGRHEVRLSKDGGRARLKVLHLSDLHASPVVELAFIKRAIHLGLDERPDLICLTGDFITHRYDEFDRYAKILRPLADAAPTFACLGNHDGGSWASRHHGYADTSGVRDLLANSGVALLDNAAATVRLRGRDLTVVGVGDPWAHEFQPVLAFPPAPRAAGDTTLVLSHNPDTKEYLKDYAWDLLLCGHTHGGQVCVPFFETVFAPVRDKRFVQGLHPWNGRWLHVTRGVGNVHGVRFNCPPEVSLLTLV